MKWELPTNTEFSASDHENQIGTSRPITRVRYNLDGDLLFTSSKEKQIFSWRGEEYQPLSVYNGHTDDSIRLLSASADSTIVLWDTETASSLHKIEARGPCVLCGISLSQEMFYYIYTFKESFTIEVYNFSDEYPLLFQEVYQGIPNCAIWGCLDEKIIVGLESGEIIVFDLSTKTVKSIKGHSSSVSDIQMSRDYLHFITCSSDMTVRVYFIFKKIWDVITMEKISFKTGIELNSVSISPYKDFFVCSGGVHSSRVTHTKGNILDILFIDIKSKKNIATILSAHSGPVNSIRIRPDGKSGSEDSSINTYDIFEQQNMCYL